MKAPSSTRLARLGMGILLLWNVAHAETDPLKVTFKIEAQPLGDALNAFAAQSGYQLLFPSKIGKEIIASPVHGLLAPEQALQKILAESGLHYEFINPHTVAIRSAVSPNGAQPLGASEQYAPLRRLAQVSGTSAEEQGSNAEGSTKQLDSSGTREPEKLEEIVVTAQKREQRLQDVPVTVSAVTAEQIEKMGAVDLKDVLRTVPGLTFSNVERGQSRYSIRGVSTNIETPTTGIYLDDISLTTNASLFFGAADAILFDLERVEVLKGPQGTLYGSSSMGGAIKYVTARPNLTKQEFQVAAGVGTTAHGSESYNAEAIANIPLISDVLALRTGFAYIHEGGFIDNVAGLAIENTAYSSTSWPPTYTPLVRSSLSTQSREDYNFADTYVGRVSLLWQPTDSLSIRPSALYQDSTLENPNYILTNQPGLVSSYRDVSQETPDRLAVYSLDIKQQWGPVELTSLTGYIDRDQSWNRDYSFFVGNLRSAGINQRWYALDSDIHRPIHITSFSQELRLASAPDAESRLHWVGGVYYSSQDQNIRGVVITTPDAGFPALLGHPDAAYVEDGQDKFKQSALFGEATYDITQALDLTLGARYYEVERETIPGPSGGPVVGGGPGPVAAPSTIREYGLNPKIGLSYKLAEDHLIYASGAKGFRPGGTTSRTFDSACNEELARVGLDPANLTGRYDSDDLWTYELGSKNELAGGRALLNGAVFYTDWKGLPQGIRFPNCGASITANVGSAVVRGAELETRFDIAAVQLGGNVTYMDAEITDPGFGNLAIVKGDRILDTPEWIASAFAGYSMPITDHWDLELQVNYQYLGEQHRQYATTQNARDPVTGVATAVSFPRSVLYQAGYDVMNAFAILSKGPTNVRLYVNNVMDERPFLDTNYTVGISRTTTIRPRTIGVEVRHEF